MLRKYSTHEDAGVVVCTLITDDGRSRKGKARCCPKDKFELLRGQTISFFRALLKIKRMDRQDLQKQYDALKSLLEIVERRLKKKEQQLKDLNDEINNITMDLNDLIND